MTDKHGNVLKQGVDYDVEFINIDIPGEGTVVITGKGNYDGFSTNATLKVVKHSTMSQDTVTGFTFVIIALALGIAFLDVFASSRKD